MCHVTIEHKLIKKICGELTSSLYERHTIAFITGLVKCGRAIHIPNKTPPVAPMPRPIITKNKLFRATEIEKKN